MTKTTWTILHTEWSDGWGGQERRIVSEMAGMAARGHRMILATRAQAQIVAHAQAAGVEVVTLPFQGKFELATIRPLMALIRQQQVDVVNTHSGKDSWSGGLAAWRAGCCLVRTRHLNIPLRRSWHNFIHRLPAAIVTCGDTMRQQLMSNGFPPAQLVNIPTGIDFTAFQPRSARADVRAALGVSDAAPVVLMTGVIRAVKRHEIALRAFAQVLARYPQAMLLLAGDGPMRRDMEALVQQLGLGQQVRFLGHREDVPDLMAAADYALLTSRSEGVPQAVTQGLGLALPTVATAVGGVPELIQHERTGLLATPEDENAVAEQLLRLLADPAWARELGRAGQQHVLQEFSLTAMLDKTEALYARLLAQRKSR
ncbi:glycosyltransferase family 4 protein [Aquaspirillum soli]